MRVLLTSAGLETEEIKEYFVKMIGMDMSGVKALFIPTAAIDAGAIEVLPKCMNDLLKCGIQNKNVKVLICIEAWSRLNYSNMMWFIYVAETLLICLKE